MRNFRGLIVGLLGISLTATLVHAQAKLVQESLGPDGDAIGGSVSPHGSHAAMLVAKGSRFVVMLDGVAGPKIDALLNNIMGGPVGGTYWAGKIPVFFSNDGAHSAYVGKVGDEFVVYLDGKELTRGPLRAVGQANIGLSFSNNGQHLYYMDQDDAGKYRIVVDGKPGPGSQQPQQLVLSPDGNHYAYVGYQHNGEGPPWGVVDGRQVNFFGDNLQYTGRNVLLSTISDNNVSILVLNGKPEVKAAQISPMWISPDGLQIAIVITPKMGDPSFLTINGKMIPDTQGLQTQHVYFSADGKRWAALCQTKTGSKFMIIDGKKGDEYQDIPNDDNLDLREHWRFVTGTDVISNDIAGAALLAFQLKVPGFTADSSKFVYMASQGGRNFMITEDQESDGYPTVIAPTLSAIGNRIGLIGSSNNGPQHILIDGQDQQIASSNTARASALTFSPKATRYAYISGQSLNVDGVIQPGVVNGPQYVFSPDDKHIAYLASVAGKNCVVMDGKVFNAEMPMLQCLFFTPDSRHIIWVRRGSFMQGTKDSYGLYVDGNLIAHYADFGGGIPPIFEFTPDGVLTFVTRTDDTFRRFKITMPTDTTVDTILAAAPAAK
jgi:hypothetical protein